MKYMPFELAKNYNRKEFNKLFELHDENKNGFIEKFEMAWFIINTFGN